MKKKLSLVALAPLVFLCFASVAFADPSSGTVTIYNRSFSIDLDYSMNATFLNRVNSMFTIVTSFAQNPAFTLHSYRANPAWTFTGPGWPYISPAIPAAVAGEPNIIYIFQTSPASPFVVLLLVCVPSLAILVASEDRRKKKRRRLKNMWDT